jgi:hypothetical protein
MSTAALPTISRSDLTFLVTECMKWLYEYPNDDAQIREEMTLYNDAQEAWLPIALRKAREILQQQVEPWAVEHGQPVEED